jgi:TonB family protein
MSLIVGTDGVPQDVKVVRGLGFGLDEKAIEAVEGWRFKPATRDGVPLAVPAQVEVNFQLPFKK